MQHSPRQLLKISFIVVILLGGSVYIYSQLDTLLTGPQIAIENPATFSSRTTEQYVVVSGTARNITELALNGSPIVINQYREFSEPLLLAEGFNILEVTAADRFGNTATETRILIYEPEQSKLITAPTTTVPIESTTTIMFLENTATTTPN